MTFTKQLLFSIVLLFASLVALPAFTSNTSLPDTIADPGKDATDQSEPFNAAQFYFARYWPQIAVDDQSLNNLIRYVESNKEDWLANSRKRIPMGVLAYRKLNNASAKSRGAARSSGMSSSATHAIYGLQIAFQIIGDEIYLVLPNDSLGSGTFSTFRRRVHYPSFRARALGVPRRYETHFKTESSIRAFRRQYDVYSHLLSSDVHEMWRSILKPIAIDYGWIVLPLMDIELIDVLLPHSNDSGLPVFNYAERMSFVLELARAVKYLHEHGVAHNDLKPDNVFLVWLNGRYRSYLSDLNLATIPARLIHDGRAREAAGSPHYAAPEIWQGLGYGEGTEEEQAEFALKADIFSLSVSAYSITYKKNPSFVSFDSWIESALEHRSTSNYGDELTRNLETFFENFWQSQEHRRIAYFFAAGVRIAATERINAANFFRAWDYLFQRPVRNAASCEPDFTIKVAEERFATFAYKIWDIGDQEAEALLAKQPPGDFILRLIKSEPCPHFAVSFVLPQDEQRITGKITQHILLDKALDEPKLLFDELQFFKELKLLAHEFHEAAPPLVDDAEHQ